MKTEEQTNIYLENRKSQKNLYRPKYHFSPEFGWCNDPHGIVYFKGEYHLFFQFHPFETLNKEMYWGHTTTKDFIHFSSVKVAISPTNLYDNSGCWSGSVIIKDDVMYIFYTGFSLHNDGKYYQTVCVATSYDGRTFEKSSLNPLIDRKKIPLFASVYDFRDPCVFKEGDKYYLIIGSKNDNEAMILLYGSDDLLEWNFIKPLIRSFKHGTMFECPNIVRFEDNAYIIMSPQNIKIKGHDFYNVSSSIYFKIDRNILSDCNNINDAIEIDHGFEFYAPNVYENEKITVAREQMWGRRYYLHELSNDYINNFTLFKQIKRHKNRLQFVPLCTYESLFKNEKNQKLSLDQNKKIIVENKITSHFVLTFKPEDDLLFKLSLCVNQDRCVLISFDFKTKLITIDRTKMDVQLNGVDNTLATKGIRYLSIDETNDKYKIEVYLDIPSIEIFLHDYIDSISFLAFTDSGNIQLESNKKLEVTLIQNEIEV